MCVCVCLSSVLLFVILKLEWITVNDPYKTENKCMKLIAILT